jgi:hypothetical protein
VHLPRRTDALTTTGDTDDWRPTDVLHPGTCPPHLSQAMRQAIAEGLQAEEDRLRLIRQRSEETK